MSELEKVATNADKALGEGVEVVLGGVKRKIKFSLYAYCKIEEQSGGKVNPFDPEFYKTITPTKMSLLAWAGCLYENPNLDYKEFAQTIGMKDMDQLPLIIQAAVGQSQTDDPAKKNSQEMETQEQEPESIAPTGSELLPPE